MLSVGMTSTLFQWEVNATLVFFIAGYDRLMGTCNAVLENTMTGFPYFRDRYVTLKIRLVSKDIKTLNMERYYVFDGTVQRPKSTLHSVSMRVVLVLSPLLKLCSRLRGNPIS